MYINIMVVELLPVSQDYQAVSAMVMMLSIQLSKRNETAIRMMKNNFVVVSNLN